MVFGRKKKDKKKELEELVRETSRGTTLMKARRVSNPVVEYVSVSAQNGRNSMVVYDLSGMMNHMETLAERCGKEYMLHELRKLETEGRNWMERTFAKAMRESYNRTKTFYHTEKNMKRYLKEYEECSSVLMAAKILISGIGYYVRTENGFSIHPVIEDEFDLN